MQPGDANREGAEPQRSGSAWSDYAPLPSAERNDITIGLLIAGLALAIGWGLWDAVTTYNDTSGSDPRAVAHLVGGALVDGVSIAIVVAAAVLRRLGLPRPLARTALLVAVALPWLFLPVFPLLWAAGLWPWVAA